MPKKKATEMYLNILLESLIRTTRGLSKENRLSGSEFRVQVATSGRVVPFWTAWWRLFTAEIRVSKWRDIVCSV